MSNSCKCLDCSPLGSSVLGIFQARIPEWVAISFFRGSSWPRDQTPVSCTVGRFFIDWATREALVKNVPANAGDARVCGFDPWGGKIPWHGKEQPTPVFLPGGSHRQRSLGGYSPWGHKESDKLSHWARLLVWMYLDLFDQSWINGHLNCVNLLLSAITNSVSVNNLIYVIL